MSRRTTRGMAVVALLAVVGLVGCGQSNEAGKGAKASKGGNGTSATTPVENEGSVAKDEGPAAAVSRFLEAVRTGNDEAAAQMLSKVARQKAAALNRSVTPPASDTATFTVGKVDIVEGGARVESTWTDYDAERKKKTDTAYWIVRQEEEGWRIAGVAAQALPGEPYVILNFEKPEEMVQKLKSVREEMLRRMEKEEADLQAQGTGNQEKPLRR